MAGGPAAPGSPTLAFAGGVMETEGAAGGARTGGSQEAWEAFNRHMDEQDKAIAEAAAAVAAADGAAGGARGDGGGRGAARELPTAMLEVLKVSLSLLRRFSSRNLTVAGAYASSVHMWPSGHVQVCWGWMEAEVVMQK